MSCSQICQDFLNDRVLELFESIFLTICMCLSMKPLERGYPGDEVVCLMPKPERNLANSLLWNIGPLSDTISSGYPSIEKRSIRRSLNDLILIEGKIIHAKFPPGTLWNVMRLEGLLGHLRPFDTFLALLGVIFNVCIDSSPVHMLFCILLYLTC